MTMARVKEVQGHLEVVEVPRPQGVLVVYLNDGIGLGVAVVNGRSITEFLQLQCVLED